MVETSFYESFSVATIEKNVDESLKTFKLSKGLFIAGEFINEAPNRINILPKPGSYTHAIYGTVKVTRERNQEFIDNFHQEVYQKLIPIDLEHETFLSGAVGYYEPGSAMMDIEGSVTIGVRWEERGAKALNEGRFYYFSPMWFDKWKEPLSGKVYNNVLIGGALTTTPYFKDANLRPLYASELSVSQVHVDGPMDKEDKTDGGKDEKQETGKCADCGGTMGPDGKCVSCGKSKKASEITEEKTEEKTVVEEKTAPVTTPVVDPAAFSDLQAKIARMEQANAVAADELKKANEIISRHASERRQRMFREVIMGTNQEADGAKAFSGEASVHARVLDAIYSLEGEEGITGDESLFNAYTAEMRGLSERLADGESLRQRGGVGSRDPKKTSARNEWDTEVAKVMSEQKLTQTEAYVHVAREKPELYIRQNEENYVPKGEKD